MKQKSLESNYIGLIVDKLNRVVILDIELLKKIDGAATYDNTSTSNDNLVCPHVNPACTNQGCLDLVCDLGCH